MRNNTSDTPREPGTRLARYNAWSQRHRQLLDIVKAFVLIGILLVFEGGARTSALLFEQNDVSIVMWSFLYVIPLSTRRTHADSAAITFIVMALAQIIVGPSMLMANLVALEMLYSVIVYGNPKYSHRYTYSALLMGVVTSVVNLLAVQLGIADIRTPDQPRLCSQFSCLVTAGNVSDVIVMLIPLEISLLSAVAIGYWRRARIAQMTVVRERNRALELSQREESRIAALAERSRIARDMHDVVAHTLSIIIVQADGGRFAGAHNPTGALETLDTIQTEARNATSGMQGLLGTLKTNGNGTSQEHPDIPQLPPRYTSLDALIHEAQLASGPSLTVQRTVHGTAPLATMSEQLSHTIFRTVQESLSNVRKYAGTGTHVDIIEVWYSQGVMLTISDDGVGATASSDGHHPGYGLIGMHERITALGGTLEAGPLGGQSTQDHGFIVRAWLPLEPAGPTAQQGSDTSQKVGNVIERFSRWTQANYFVADVVLSLFTALFMLGVGSFRGILGTTGALDTTITLAFCLGFGLPLMLRRRRPQLSAALVAGVLIISLLVTPLPINTGTFVGLFSLYSAVLYAPASARRWIIPVSLSIIALAVTNVWAVTGLSSPYDPSQGGYGYTTTQLVAALVSTGFTVGLAWAATFFFALWKRSRNTDLFLLKSQEEALMTQRDRQATLAANLERARISEEIQHEVTSTLSTVLVSTKKAHREIQAIADRTPPGSEPSAEESHRIESAFTSIATTGRRALAQMRELLGILRQNESAEAAARPQLSPIMAPEPHERETHD